MENFLKENIHPNRQKRRTLLVKEKDSRQVLYCSKRLNAILEESENPAELPLSPRTCFNIFRHSRSRDEYFLLPRKITNFAQSKQVLKMAKLSAELVKCSEVKKTQFKICREVLGSNENGCVWLYKGNMLILIIGNIMKCLL